MNLYKLDDIQIPIDRQRKEFDPDALQELSDSIAAIGLLHPLVVKAVEGGVELVAGESRYKAIRMLQMMGTDTILHDGKTLPIEEVPCVLVNDDTPWGLYASELHENIQRRDLTWQERVAAIARMGSLLKKASPDLTQREVNATLASDLQPAKASVAADAVARREVQKQLVVARHMDDPDVAKASSLADAFKVVVRKEDAARNAALAASVGTKKVTELHQVYNMNCLSFLETYEGDPFDVILTDPPYGMDADSFGDAAGKLVGITHDYKDSREHAMFLIKEMLALATKHCKPKAHLYLYCDIDNYHEIKGIAEGEGWTVHRTPLMHLKREGGRVPWPENGPRRAYELVLYAMRGKKPVTHIYPDVFDTSLSEGNLGHGAQKPVEGYVDLLKRSTIPGDLVFDGFGGTGTVIPACHQLKLRSIYVEKHPAAFGIALKRLENLK